MLEGEVKSYDYFLTGQCYGFQMCIRDSFNTVRPREYDGSHLVIPGMNSEMKLRKHQLDFVARVIYTGTGLAAHEVGAGKTAALIAAGMYLKNLGAIQMCIRDSTWVSGTAAPRPLVRPGA